MHRFVYEGVSIKTRHQRASKAARQLSRKFTKGKKRLLRSGLFLINVFAVLGILGFVVFGVDSSKDDNIVVLDAVTEEREVDPLDKLSSADIAVSIAELARLEETTAVKNNADTINSQLDIVPADSQVVAKPQIVSTEIRSINDLVEYKVKEGDTVSDIAKQFGISSDSIKWSNDLSGNSLNAGDTILIPPVDGIVYTVKDGDTAEKIAENYRSDADAIIAFNDAELTGIKKGQQIVIPNGEVPAPVRRSVPSYSGFRFGSSAVYGYNGYVYGYCTWYAANKRAQDGRPIPANLGNASTWKVLAQRAGIPVGNTPKRGAVIWTPPNDYYGHVGYVEEVYADGSVRISEMNYAGWNVVTSRVLTPQQAAYYSYIY